MIEFHYLIYILFLTATSSKQISVGVILPFYDGLWGYYGDQFLLYNKNKTKTENFSIEVYYCNKSASIQQSYAAEFISRKFEGIKKHSRICEDSSIKSSHIHPSNRKYKSRRIYCTK